MTVNISCMTFVLTTAVFLGHSPFVVVQLLWINLIMDVLAAIAFATEAPHPTEIRKERVSVKDPLITKPMMRAILSQSLYQLITMLILMYAGPQIADIPYNLFSSELNVKLGNATIPTWRMEH